MSGASIPDAIGRTPVVALRLGRGKTLATRGRDAGLMFVSIDRWPGSDRTRA